MLFSISASHSSAEFGVLERLAGGAAGAAGIRGTGVASDPEGAGVVGAALASAHRAVRGAVVLATCNRFEAYLDLAIEDDASFVDPVAAVVEAIAGVADMSAQELRPALRFARGPGAVHHLFAVTAGLESVIVGETEITGQVRRSLETATREGTVTPELATAFARALEASRDVRSATGIAVAGRSVVRTALDLAAREVEDWGRTRALLVGTGRYAAAALAALRERGVTDIAVYSVSDWGPPFAQEHGVPLVARADYPAQAATAHLIVACTRASHTVLDGPTLLAGRDRAGALAAASTVVLDLGLPRNVAESVGDVAATTLIDLETVRLYAADDDDSVADAARQRVGLATERFAAAQRRRDAGPGLAALRDFLDGAVADELARGAARGTVTPAVEEAVRHLASTLLHGATVRAGELAAQGRSADWLDALDVALGVAAFPERTSASTRVEADVKADSPPTEPTAASA